MKNTSFIIISIILILVISNLHNIKKKNKFRLTILTDGFINKILLGFFLLIILFEHFSLGLLFMILLLSIQIDQINNEDNLEAFNNYFISANNK
jgi:hypothetical protein